MTSKERKLAKPRSSRKVATSVAVVASVVMVGLLTVALWQSRLVPGTVVLELVPLQPGLDVDIESARWSISDLDEIALVLRNRSALDVESVAVDVVSHQPRGIRDVRTIHSDLHIAMSDVGRLTLDVSDGSTESLWNAFPSGAVLTVRLSGVRFEDGSSWQGSDATFTTTSASGLGIQDLIYTIPPWRLAGENRLISGLSRYPTNSTTRDGVCSMVMCRSATCENDSCVLTRR